MRKKKCIVFIKNLPKFERNLLPLDLCLLFFHTLVDKIRSKKNVDQLSIDVKTNLLKPNTVNKETAVVKTFEKFSLSKPMC